MADFNTHITVAAAASGLAATNLMLFDLASNQAVLVYFAFGTLGGILPDIDSDTSIPFRTAFNVLAVLAAFAAIFLLGSGFSLLELVLLGLGCFFAVRWVVCPFFASLTVHRGLIHSIPMAAVCGLAAVSLSHTLMHFDAVSAWMAGAFLAFGFLVHLALDEIYSVDLMGGKIKRSFGTALCLGQFDNPLGTAAVYLSAVLLYVYAVPPPEAFIHVLENAETQGWLRRLLPHGSFFGVNLS